MGKRVKVEAKKPEVKQSILNSQMQMSENSRSMDTGIERILFLQRTVGNQAVVRLMKSGVLQAKLRIGQPGDVYEQEVDRVAEQVMRMPEPQSVFSGTSNIQRIYPGCEDEELKRQPMEEEEEELQRQSIEEEEEELQPKTTSDGISEVNPDIESHIQNMRGGGKPLPESTRAFFELRFGYDFSQVRVHTDTKAADAAREMNARAYTVGRDVVFGAGQYAPETGEGRKLLAHELTHLVQQQGIRHINNVQDKLEITKSGGSMKNKSNSSPDHEMFIEGRILKSLTSTQLSIQRACGSKEIGTPECASGGNMSYSFQNFSRPFLFDKNCDSFKKGEDEALREFVLNYGSSDAFIEIHGFASMDGPIDFNLNLSCARAHRATTTLIDARISPTQIRSPIKHGRTEGDEHQQRSVVILIDKKPIKPPGETPPCTFNHSAAAAYAKTWAKNFNPAFVRFANDCTNFVSQALLAGGWCMIFGENMCAERKNNNVWWHRQNACPRWVISDIHASNTWGGAQNFADFVSTSVRGTKAGSEMDLVEGDVLQMRFSKNATIHHSMVVTGKTSTDLLLSYHTNNRLDEPLSQIRSRNPDSVFIPWKIL